jgi:hypothetical protein
VNQSRLAINSRQVPGKGRRCQSCSRLISGAPEAVWRGERGRNPFFGCAEGNAGTELASVLLAFSEELSPVYSITVNVVGRLGG